MANIRKMYDEGRLVMAGPFVDDTAWPFRPESSIGTTGTRLGGTRDPAVKAGRLKAEVHGPWLIRPDHIHKSSEVVMEQYSVVLVKRKTGENLNEIEKMDSSGEVAVGGEIRDTGDLAALTIYAAGSGKAKDLTELHHAERSRESAWKSIPGSPQKASSNQANHSK